MKIRLIEPKSPSLHLWSPLLYPRLGLPMIGAALTRAGHDVRIYCEHIAPVDWDDVVSCDLVGISATTATAPAAYELAARLREQGIPSVIGGPHVTFAADEALAYTEYVARGEGGESLMLELIEALHGRRELESIRGLSFTRSGRPVHNPPREPVDNLDDLPVPDLSLIVGHERMKSTPIMTSWGCPFACNFCSVTAMFGRRYRYRSPEAVIAEIEDKRPTHIFFYDDNFAADKRRLKTLLRLMIERGLVIPWQAQMRTDATRDDELLDLMRRSGCHRVALGLESVDQATLDGFQKGQTIDDVVHAIRRLHEFGIECHGMFVLGADTDTQATLRDTVDFALAHGIDTLMLNILTPAPGTEQFADMEAAGQIFQRDWRFYDGQHVVFTPRQVAPSDLQAQVLRGYARFYSLRRLLGHVVRLRFAAVRDCGWCWWFSRRWRWDPFNRAYLKALKETPASGDGPTVTAESPPDTGSSLADARRAS
jgi:anaerobic magnesium-protoporphyrin IX monomethyl ester cyclase